MLIELFSPQPKSLGLYLHNRTLLGCWFKYLFKIGMLLREISKSQAKALSEFFNIDAGLFI